MQRTTSVRLKQKKGNGKCRFIHNKSRESEEIKEKGRKKTKQKGNK